MEKHFNMKMEEKLLEDIRVAAFEERVSMAEWMRIAAEEKLERSSSTSEAEPMTGKLLYDKTPAVPPPPPDPEPKPTDADKFYGSKVVDSAEGKGGTHGKR